MTLAAIIRAFSNAKGLSFVICIITIIFAYLLSILLSSESIISFIPLSTDILFKKLWLASSVVIIEVVIEEIDFFKEIGRFVEVWKTSGLKIAIVYTLRHWRKVVASVESILLLIGLSGELIFQSQVETRDLFAKAESDEKIERLKIDAAKLSLEAKTAEGKIADAQSATAEATRKANDASERAARLEAENLKLDAEISPRRIGRNGIIAVPSNIITSINAVIRITTYALDVESAIFGNQLIELATKIGYSVQNCLLTQSSLGSLQLGILVSGKRQDLINNWINFFTENKITARAGTQPPAAGISMQCSNVDPDVAIFVGAKPLDR